MAERIIEFLTHLLKMGKEQLFLKSELIRNKVPMKPVLGLTGLGVLFMAVRPLFTNTNDNTVNIQPQIESSITPNEKSDVINTYDVKRTLQLMREKEKELKSKQEESILKR